MRKPLRIALPFFGTALVLALSFAMPGAVSSAQDRHLEVKVSQIETAVTALEGTLSDRLRLFFAKSYLTVQMAWDETANADAANLSALEAMDFFSDDGCDRLQYGAYTVQQEFRSLAVSADGSQTAFLSEYILSDPQGNTVALHLDDESKKVVYFYLEPANSVTLTSRENPSESEVRSWADHCVEYYGFQSVEVQPQKTTVSGLKTYRFLFADETGQALEASLLMAKNMMVFQFGSYE